MDKELQFENEKKKIKLYSSDTTCPFFFTILLHFDRVCEWMWMAQSSAAFVQVVLGTSQHYFLPLLLPLNIYLGCLFLRACGTLHNNEASKQAAAVNRTTTKTEKENVHRIKSPRQKRA